MYRFSLVLLTAALSLFAAKPIDFEREIANLAGTVTAVIKPESAARKILFLPLNDSRAPGFGSLVEEYLAVPLRRDCKTSLIDHSAVSSILNGGDISSLIKNPPEAGRLSSANFLLTGTVSAGFDKTYLVTLKLVSTETSKVVGAASLEIPASELEKRVRRN